MRRRDRTGGKLKARRHKALTPKAMRRPSSSPASRETNVARLSRELSEAFEQQAATAEILNVISNSPTDTQPVFDAIVQSGLKLFPGALVSVALTAGVKRTSQKRSPKSAIDRVEVSTVHRQLYGSLTGRHYCVRSGYPFRRLLFWSQARAIGEFRRIPRAQASQGRPR